MAGENKVAVTYETLFELLRNEKKRDELQKLEKSFLDDVSNYLEEKEQMMQGSQSKLNLFSDEEREKTAMQLRNIRKILKDLYEKRERKIVVMALNKSRTQANIIDISPLLEREKEFFEELTRVFNKYRKEYREGILLGMLKAGVKVTVKTPVAPL